ncbi:MAG: glycosyltransferase family 4 protein [Alphaproteobacteria bacterium]|nr:glycosyltransferase family 4 protein [Alphaproteobacteria bacterium]
MSKRKKILFVCTQDWFFQSHFLPLAQAVAKEDGYQGTLLTTLVTAHKKLASNGLELVPLDFKRSSMNPLSALVVLWRLVVALRRQRPDIVHFIALKPVLLGGLAALFVPGTGIVYHVTGLGFLAEGKSRFVAFARWVCFSLLGLYLKRKRSWLVCENPDDLDFLAKYGAPVTTRASIFGGAGVNPEQYPQMPPGAQNPPRAAYVGRMIWTKGLDVLVEAMEKLAARGIALNLDMYGAPDAGNPKAVPVATLEQWSKKPGVKWHGPTRDILKVWRQSEIAIISTRTREGMPRAMLEAASCGRALIVTDIAGCRHFVRDGVEGLVVPPEDSDALARALEKLALDKALRKRMGHAARQRVLNGYTERHVQEAALKIYATLLKTL